MTSYLTTELSLLSIDGIKLGDSLAMVVDLDGWKSAGEELRVLVQKSGWESIGEYYANKIKNEGWDIADSLYYQDWQDSEGLFFGSSGITVENEAVVRVYGRRLEHDGEILYQAGDSWETPFRRFGFEIPRDCSKSAPFRVANSGMLLETMFLEGTVQLSTLRLSV